MKEESGRYVYCIMKSPGEKKSFGNIGFGGQEVYTLEYRDFAPVMSNAALKKYEAIDEEVELHRKVVEQVMKEHSVLPVAYGMAFKNKKLLLIAMSVGYKAMKKAMNEVDNRVELGVKLFLPKENATWDGKEECKSVFLEALKKKAVQSKELKLFSERLILNTSFLIDRDKINDFSSEVEQLGNKYPDLKIQYSGPWPPYNFVDIQILSRKRGGFR
ncbi:MAG: GvpL/GvpF family gas vesicle protein [Candidatus Methanoperedens sp.]|nr:GvpL/GvpF family gas vesicle protein [Candidatus Methanoperedens sp.]